ncbi:alpha/beta fold hydrolase [Paucibacter sp. O1-1]|nr:alpha/beta fold hydrolase [Paucibacter sp. O1-1]MDA3827440.1 alpha/beta fold hydrolase [Paucibacter sp. O1-1]
MNARIQRFQMMLRLLLALGALLWLWPRGPVLAISTGLLLFWFYGLVMALNFGLLLRINASATTAPGALQLLRAWWAEFWTCEWVFGVQQPFAERRLPDHLPPPSASAQAPRGVLLLHGYTCNRGLWNHWLPRLRQRGHAYLALSMEPAFGSIDAYADAIEAAVRRLAQATGRPPLIVAHSMGGLAVRAWWRRHGGDTARLHRIVTLGSPHAGTLMANFSSATNARQMRRGSAWLQELAAQEAPEFRQRFICYYSNCDQIVCPAGTAVLADAEARYRPGVGHLRLAFDGAVLDEVLGELSAADFRPRP